MKEKGGDEMNEIVSFLKSCGTFYLAMPPRFRPFGAVCEFEEK